MFFFSEGQTKFQLKWSYDFSYKSTAKLETASQLWEDRVGETKL